MSKSHPHLSDDHWRATNRADRLPDLTLPPSNAYGRPAQSDSPGPMEQTSRGPLACTRPHQFAD
ncbi:MAG: hypothetical protein ACM3ML_14815, partial [Micromonosporaceae bacterium]